MLPGVGSVLLDGGIVARWRWVVFASERLPVGSGNLPYGRWKHKPRTDYERALRTDKCTRQRPSTLVRSITVSVLPYTPCVESMAAARDGSDLTSCGALLCTHPQNVHMRIVGVHGVGNYDSAGTSAQAAERLSVAWTEALGSEIRPVDLRVAYYAHHLQGETRRAWSTSTRSTTRLPSWFSRGGLALGAPVAVRCNWCSRPSALLQAAVVREQIGGLSLSAELSFGGWSSIWSPTCPIMRSTATNHGTRSDLCRGK